MGTCKYVLVTPARNEEDFLGQTIESVVSQTLRPARWVIVSDGSTDRTDEIVSEAAKKHDFIRLIRISAAGRRSFSSKVNAFRASYGLLTTVAYEFIGNLDADVSFAPSYFEQVLERLNSRPGLGLAGGTIQELIDGKFVEQRNRSNSVAGAVQLFRRRCFEDFGGYVPLRYGGIDSAAEIMARMHGWEVRMFSDLVVLHHRRVSAGHRGLIRTKLRHGMGHYSLGYHPLFEMMRCAYRIADRPYVAGGCLMAAGFLWAWITGQEKEMPTDAVKYLRSEQMRTLLGLLGIRNGDGRAPLRLVP